MEDRPRTAETSGAGHKWRYNFVSLEYSAETPSSQIGFVALRVKYRWQRVLSPTDNLA